MIDILLQNDLEAASNNITELELALDDQRLEREGDFKKQSN